MINIFSLSRLKNLNYAEKGQYIIYHSMRTVNIFIKEMMGGSVQVYFIRNPLPELIVDACTINWPFLYVSFPP